MSTRPRTEAALDADALSRALRVAGAVLVVASASTFMLQHWGASSHDLWRYAMLVCQSLLLALTAYFVGRTVRDGRGARTLLALVLGTMPVSFTVLGGLVYSQFHLEPLAVLPQYLSWVAPSKPSAVLAILGTVTVLTPLAAISFLALARRSAKTLCVSFLLGNLALLIPVRQPSVIAGLLGLTVLGLVYLDGRRLAGNAELDTLEGRLARALPFVAPLIMAGRVFYLYEPTALFAGGLLLIGAGATWLATARADDRFRKLGAWPCALLSVAGWALCWRDLAPYTSSEFASVVWLGLPSAALFLAASTRASSSRVVLLALATVTALLTAVVSPIVELGTLSALTCVLVGIAVAVSGAAARFLPLTLAGAVVALFGLGAQVLLAVRADDLLRWGSLTLVGLLLILFASYVERNKARLGRAFQPQPSTTAE
jgi:hypothetical protein